jgi:cytochrome c-type biogenesis protein CcsB
MTLPHTVLLAPACAYLISGASYIWRVLRRDQRAGSVALVAGIVGAALHGVIVLAQLAADPHAIASSVSSAASLVSFLTAAAFLAANRPFRIEAIGSAVLPICFVGTLAAALYPPTAGKTPALLRSPWFFVHVPPALLAYVAFAFAFATAVMYLGEARLLHSRRIAAVIGVLPPLDRLENAMYRTAAFGFLLLTIGIATGALWAQDVWHRSWSWSPKQTASLVTWLIFATYLHYRVVRGARGRTGALLIVIGFACVVLTFIAVGLLANDQHRFF